MARIQCRFVPVDAEAFRELSLLATQPPLAGEQAMTLAQLLHAQPALSLDPVDAELLDVPVSRLQIIVAEPDPGIALYWPPSISLATKDRTADGSPAQVPQPPPAAVQTGRPVVAAAEDYPVELTERHAVLLAHDREITRASSYLDAGLSVLIRCEKLLVEHLAKEIAGRAGRRAHFVEASGAARSVGRRAELLDSLQRLVRDARPDDVVVVPHLDLLATESQFMLSSDARELIDALYERSDCVLLAFTDPSLTIPDVLASRFAAQVDIDVLPREVSTPSGRRVPVGQALVLRAEAKLFAGFDPVQLYKHIAGLNAVRLRHALQFAYHHHQGDAVQPAFRDLMDELRTFKAKNSRSFDVPNVDFDQIGGYGEVKQELARALAIVGGAAELPEHLRPDLVPRGFILHGPPGTGKTLFAKAIASALNATILVVSGPEVTDMYHGESERKVRDLFAEARRNAPAVVVFDEFDSIAGRRGGWDDGGSRASNAVVAQLLTELDGFRPEVPVLIIGTTNRIDLIDDALLRPSRFKPINVDLPDEVARREIAKVHAAHFGIAVSAALLDEIGRATDKLNGDEIRSIFRDARADELVGHVAPGTSTARRLGELLGTLRRAQQDRETPPRQGTGQRQQPAMVLLTGADEEPVVLTTDPAPGDQDLYAADAYAPAGAPLDGNGAQ
jgi:transitional endoplasmic reticulum ATPase